MSLRRDAEGMAFPDDFTVIEDDTLNRAADMDAVRLAEGEWVGFDAHLSEGELLGPHGLSQRDTIKNF